MLISVVTIQPSRTIGIKYLFCEVGYDDIICNFVFVSRSSCLVDWWLKSEDKE